MTNKQSTKDNIESLVNRFEDQDLSSHTNCHKVDNSFLNVYINNFVKKFRNYNNDEFLITISGLKRFIHNDDKVLSYLFEQLQENNFTIEFEGNHESINHIDITCKDLTIMYPISRAGFNQS